MENQMQYKVTERKMVEKVSAVFETPVDADYTQAGLEMHVWYQLQDDGWRIISSWTGEYIREGISNVYIDMERVVN